GSKIEDRRRGDQRHLFHRAVFHVAGQLEFFVGGNWGKAPVCIVSAERIREGAAKNDFSLRWEFKPGPARAPAITSSETLNARMRRQTRRMARERVEQYCVAASSSNSYSCGGYETKMTFEVRPLNTRN